MRWLVLLVLLSGCLTQTQVVERFVCCDGWVVDNVSKCVGRTPECPNSPQCRCPPCESDVKLEYKAQSVGANPCVALGCPTGTKYVASSNSDKYHVCGCEWASKISARNLVCYESKAKAESDGKTPCGICFKRM
jgi:hypothetical protein